MFPQRALLFHQTGKYAVSLNSSSTTAWRGSPSREATIPVPTWGTGGSTEEGLWVTDLSDGEQLSSSS